jgi:hypothetical protein
MKYSFKQFYKDKPQYPKLIKHPETGATIKHDLLTPETLSTVYVTKDGDYNKHIKAHKTGNDKHLLEGFAKFIVERASTGESLKGLQHHIGTISEVSAAANLVHLHKLHDTHKELLDHANTTHTASAKHLPSETAHERTMHGFHMAHAITHHLAEKYPDHQISEVHVTTKNGDIGRATKGKHSDNALENPSDLTVGLRHKKTGEMIYHGLSLKSSEKGDIGFKNPTPKHMDKALGTNADAMHTEGHNKFAEQNGISKLPNKSTNGTPDKKQAIEKTPGLKEKAKAHFGEVFKNVRDHMVKHLSSHLSSDEGQEKVKGFYAKNYMNNEHKPGAMPYSKITAMGGEKKGYSVKVDEPSENHAAKLLSDKKTKLTVHPSGNNYIHVIAHHPDHEEPIHLFSEQVKTSSGAGYSSARHNIQPPSKNTTKGMKNITLEK